MTEPKTTPQYTKAPDHVWLEAFSIYGCFLVISASVVLRLYVRRYLLKSLLVQLSAQSDLDPLYLKNFEYLVSAWRDRWLLTIGTDLLLGNRCIDIGALDRFDIFKLPARLKYAAVANVLCVCGGFIWMLLAAIWLKLML